MYKYPKKIMSIDEQIQSYKTAGMKFKKLETVRLALETFLEEMKFGLLKRIQMGFQICIRWWILLMKMVLRFVRMKITRKTIC